MRLARRADLPFVIPAGGWDSALGSARRLRRLHGVGNFLGVSLYVFFARSFEILPLTGNLGEHDLQPLG